ncbi:citrate lyase subunit beta [Terfezia boudieri ATCC MYA-4762]|uniref:Citrate lyase subunit beta n=1 Tax=Terfezia boudieri ATCC MYA-4762 TaxID=1051890 RepID=A0A3N4LDR2_9PEZI|nr:citrate lyase subunit beta [Terfezia boudieri ATCC MYA-4762]
MTSAPLFLRRALLYVPGSSTKMLERSRSLRVDCAIYDLEDSVAIALKPLARSNIQNVLQEPRVAGIQEQAFRINSVQSGLAEDDLGIMRHQLHVDSVVIPKVESASDIKFVHDALEHYGDSKAQIIALIESARAILNLREICTAVPDRLSGLIFAAEDFALDLGLERTPSLLEMLYARQSIVTAAVAHRVSAIDLVCTDYKDNSDDGPLARESRDGVTMGFTGKQIIHPSQVEMVQRLFSPSEARVTWALRVLRANEKAVQEGRGAWTLDGKMIDAPVIMTAEKLVKKAERAGIDTKALWDKYNGIKPEWINPHCCII